MPKYFFDIFAGDGNNFDQEGQELADPRAARSQALSTLPDIARETQPNGNRREFIIDVRDESVMLIFTATLSLTGRWIGSLYADLN